MFINFCTNFMVIMWPKWQLFIIFKTWISKKVFHDAPYYAVLNKTIYCASWWKIVKYSFLFIKGYEIERVLQKFALSPIFDEKTYFELEC